MPRDFVINGETMVNVQGFLSVSGGFGSFELGLTSESVRVSPRFIHRDVHIDDFGPDIPVEVINMLADVHIRMILVHYDPQVLTACVGESLGGSLIDGRMIPAGTPMGGGFPLGAFGNHYIELTLTSPFLSPWRFPAAYLTSQPLEIPLGTERSLVQLDWRAIPYTIPNFSSGPMAGPVGITFFSGSEIISSGVALWYRS